MISPFSGIYPVDEPRPTLVSANVLQISGSPEPNGGIHYAMDMVQANVVFEVS
jgi:hypothetical protein